MKRHLATAVVVTGALIAALELGPGGSVWSPGVLAKVHQQVPCSGCHDPFDSFASADKCLGCHQQSQPRPADQFPGRLCARCHREHGGDDVDLASAPAGSCGACHDASWVPLKSREPIASAAALKPRSFHAYHEDAGPTVATSATSAPAAPGAPCLRCHPIDIEAHAGEHDAGGADDCLACHAGVHGDDPSVGPTPKHER